MQAPSTKQELAQLDLLKNWKETKACKTDVYLLPNSSVALVLQDLPTCFVASLVSLATPARGPLHLASAKKHHTLFLRCRHALRLQCAATERDGLRVGTAVIEP